MGGEFPKEEGIRTGSDIVIVRMWLHFASLKEVHQLGLSVKGYQLGRGRLACVDIRT